MPRGPTPNSRQIAVARDHAREIFELRKQGLSQTAIAERVGVTQGAVSRSLKAYLAKLAAETMEDAEEVRSLELERLDAILIPMLQAATSGEETAVDRVIKIMDRRAKLLGLDAPTKAHVTADVNVQADYSKLDPLELEALIELEKKALGE